VAQIRYSGQACYESRDAVRNGMAKLAEIFLPARAQFVRYDRRQTVYRMYIRAQRMHMVTNMTTVLSFSRQESLILVMQPGPSSGNAESSIVTLQGMLSCIAPIVMHRVSIVRHCNLL
jgi:hypothetical protein